MERLTKPTIGCFEYDLAKHEHKIGEFAEYDAFFNYSMAVRQLGHYEDLNLSPAEIAEKLKELAELQSKISEIHKSLDWADKLRAKTINYTELAINNGLALGKIAVLLNHEYADNPPKGEKQ